MFKKILNGMSAHKYKIIGVLIISFISLINFMWLVTTGESFDVRENKVLLYILFVFRCLIYIALIVLIDKKLKGRKRIYFGRLLAFGILFYELVVVFNVPMLLIERLGA